MISDVSNIGVLTAFAAGVVSFLSPCVLPLVPAYASFVAGHTLTRAHHRGHFADKLSTLALSLCFVLGFSTIFVLSGTSATALSQMFLRYGYETNIIGGAIVVIFGLLMTGALKIHFFQRDFRLHPHVGSGQPLGASVLAVAFGFGWAPCIGPVLGGILTISAMTGSLSSGIILLTIYSAGLGIPFLAFAAFAGVFGKRLKQIGGVGRWMQVAAGVIMIAMGLAMITGQLSAFALWLLRTFPVFRGVG